jgi:hypothetical protein
MENNNNNLGRQYYFTSKCQAMILSELAGQVLAILSPLLIKGGESLMQGAGKDLWESVKGLFKKENKEAVLEKFENDPGNENAGEEVKVNLTAIMYADEQTRKQVEKLVAAYQQGNKVTAAGNQKSVIAGNDISGNTITIN